MLKQQSKKAPAKSAAAAAKSDKSGAGFTLSLQNYKLMLAGFAIIVVGFVLMSGGKSPDPQVFNADELYSFRRITLAPIIVIFGFAFEIYAIMKRPAKAGNPRA
ncbi:MAG: DUF3098 domain-containing protein [Prevotellaceae bacterium]|jgi:hypothetical protein|nr:DUF3098 domain-containing protein [Prevotellaceae bacterium]